MSQKLTSLIENLLTTDSSLSFDPKQLSRFMLGTEGLTYFEKKQRNILAIIRLTQSHEIKALLDLANHCATDEELAFSLYPISTGNNWGYGTSQPAGTAKTLFCWI